MRKGCGMDVATTAPCAKTPFANGRCHIWPYEFSGVPSRSYPLRQLGKKLVIVIGRLVADDFAVFWNQRFMVLGLAMALARGWAQHGRELESLFSGRLARLGTFEHTKAMGIHFQKLGARSPTP